MDTYIPAKLTTIKDDAGGTLYWAEGRFPDQPGRHRASAVGLSFTSPRIALDALIEKVKLAGHAGIVVNGPDGQIIHIS